MSPTPDNSRMDSSDPEEFVFYTPVGAAGDRLRLEITTTGLALDLLVDGRPARAVEWTFDELASIAFGTR